MVDFLTVLDTGRDIVAKRKAIDKISHNVEFLSFDEFELLPDIDGFLYLDLNISHGPRVRIIALFYNLGQERLLVLFKGSDLTH